MYLVLFWRDTSQYLLITDGAQTIDPKTGEPMSLLGFLMSAYITHISPNSPPTPASMITHKSHIPGFSSQLAGGSMEEAPLPQQLVTTSITQGGTLKNL